MHPSLARRFLLVVALVGLLFTLDAAVESAVPPSYLLGIVVLALAAVLLWRTLVLRHAAHASAARGSTTPAP